MLANLLFVVAADVAATVEVAANATADDVDDDDEAALTLTAVLFTVADMLTLFPLLYFIVPLLQFVFAPTPLLLLALPLLGIYFAAAAPPTLVVVVAVVAVAFAVVLVADDGTDGEDDDGCGTILFTNFLQ